MLQTTEVKGSSLWFRGLVSTSFLNHTLYWLVTSAKSSMWRRWIVIHKDKFLCIQTSFEVQRFSHTVSQRVPREKDVSEENNNVPQNYEKEMIDGVDKSQLSAADEHLKILYIQVWEWFLSSAQIGNRRGLWKPFWSVRNGLVLQMRWNLLRNSN